MNVNSKNICEIPQKQTSGVNGIFSIHKYYTLKYLLIFFSFIPFKIVITIIL